MAYKIELTQDDINNILKALPIAEENEILNYKTVGELWDKITEQVEKQRAGADPDE
jgi:CO dehydrogenase/acetyl-CoA synthase alpha subunit